MSDFIGIIESIREDTILAHKEMREVGDLFSTLQTDNLDWNQLFWMVLSS